MSKDQGYIKMYREIMSKPIWLNSSPEHKSLLVTLLLMAKHRPGKWELNGKLFDIQPGQFVTTLDEIKKNCGKGVSIQNIRSGLKRFEQIFQFLTSKSTNKGRLITIINWGSYQAGTCEPTSDTTSAQQVPNKCPTNANKTKNVKNVKKTDKHTSVCLSEPDDEIDHLEPIKPKKQQGPPCPHMEIIEAYHRILPELKQVHVWGEPYSGYLQARWREDTERQSLTWWEGLFRYIRQSGFLMGRKREFQADLAWIVRRKSFVNILNGRYEDREAANPAQSGIAQWYVNQQGAAGNG